MASFVLIHGAFHGGWCFDPITEILRARGHEVVAPDLPGMGGSEEELRSVTLDSWGKFTIDLCRDIRARSGGPVVLAGHSRGGMVISNAAEQDPEAMDSLVYITAMMSPATGSLEEAMAVEPTFGQMFSAIVPVENGAGLVMPREAARHHFAQNSPADLAEAALDRLVAEPAEMFATPLEVTDEGWGRVPRWFIECSDDNALSLTFQRAMIAASPGTKVITLDADHSPFYSATQALADAMEAIAGHS